MRAGGGAPPRAFIPVSSRGATAESCIQQGVDAMTDSSSSLGSELGKKAIRFAVAILGLLVLKAVVGALPMLKSASPIDGTLLSPVVLANAIVDTLIMVAIFG